MLLNLATLYYRAEFDPSKPSKYIAHGWNAGPLGMYEMKDVFLEVIRGLCVFKIVYTEIMYQMITCTDLHVK